MKFLVEFDPPANVKNAFEMDAAKQAKIGKAMETMKPISAWFAMRKGYLVIEATSQPEIAKKIAPILHLLECDATVTPVASMEEFGPMVAAMGAEAKKYK